MPNSVSDVSPIPQGLELCLAGTEPASEPWAATHPKVHLSACRLEPGCGWEGRVIHWDCTNAFPGLRGEHLFSSRGTQCKCQTSLQASHSKCGVLDSRLLGNANGPSKVCHGQTATLTRLLEHALSQVNLIPRNLTRPPPGTEPGGVGLPNPSEVLNRHRLRK